MIKIPQRGGRYIYICAAFVRNAIGTNPAHSSAPLSQTGPSLVRDRSG
ncbi:hypothetical protein J2Y86_004121 [Pseudomonas migulae]|nr:hypothetical protein [Pseudomonas migulae]